jgi:hypothetical protein
LVASYSDVASRHWLATRQPLEPRRCTWHDPFISHANKMARFRKKNGWFISQKMIKKAKIGGILPSLLLSPFIFIFHFRLIFFIKLIEILTSQKYFSLPNTSVSIYIFFSAHQLFSLLLNFHIEN